MSLESGDTHVPYTDATKKWPDNLDSAAKALATKLGNARSVTSEIQPLGDCAVPVPRQYRASDPFDADGEPTDPFTFVPAESAGGGDSTEQGEGPSVGSDKADECEGGPSVAAGPSFHRSNLEEPAAEEGAHPVGQGEQPEGKDAQPGIESDYRLPSGYGWLELDLLRSRSDGEDPEKVIEQAESLGELSKRFSKTRIKIEAQKDDRRPVAALAEVLSDRTGQWEPLEFNAEQESRLLQIGLGVAAQETERMIEPLLPGPTGVDRLAVLTEILIAPETAAPKLLGLVAEVGALHAGLPGVVARCAGEAVEQGVSPLFEPEGLRGDVLASMEGFEVTFDIANGEVTAAVVDLALDHLAEAAADKVAQAAADKAAELNREMESELEAGS